MSIVLTGARGGGKIRAKVGLVLTVGREAAEAEVELLAKRGRSSCAASDDLPPPLAPRCGKQPTTQGHSSPVDFPSCVLSEFFR